MRCERAAARPRHGFTTIELLCTIAIAAITLAIGLPSLQRGIRASATSARLEAFTSALRYARSEAFKRGETVTMCSGAVPPGRTPSCSGAAWHDGWLVFVDRGELGAFDDDEDRLLQVQADDRPGVRIDSSRRSISFRANGVAVSGTGTYVFAALQADADETLKKVVCVNKQGRARVANGACA